MVSVLTSNALVRGLELRSRQTIDYKIGMCCFSGNKFEDSTILNRPLILH